MLAVRVALCKRKEIDSIKSLKSQKVDVGQNEREMSARGPETVFPLELSGDPGAGVQQTNTQRDVSPYSIGPGSSQLILEWEGGKVSHLFSGLNWNLEID